VLKTEHDGRGASEIVDTAYKMVLVNFRIKGGSRKRKNICQLTADVVKIASL